MKNHQINFRVPEETYHLLKEYADAYDIDVATYAKISCIDITSGAWLLNFSAVDEDKIKSIRQINFRVSEEIYADIKAIAEEYEMSVPQFVKMCCIQTAHNRIVPACTVRAGRRNHQGCHTSIHSEPVQHNIFPSH